MIPVVERKGEINMVTVTGRNLVDPKKEDTIYKFVDSQSAWFFRAISGREYDEEPPKGILCLACRNNLKPGKFFAMMILEDLQLVDHESPDFDTLDEAISWLQGNIKLLFIALSLPLETVKWIDIPEEFRVSCSKCRHFVGYRENRDGGVGQGAYISCRNGCVATANCPSMDVKA